MFELVTTYSHFNGDVVVVRMKNGCHAFIANRARKRPSGWAERMVARANTEPKIRHRLEQIIERRGVPCSAVYHPETVNEVEVNLQDAAVMAGKRKKRRKKRVQRRLARRDRRVNRRLKRSRKMVKRFGPLAVRANLRVARLKRRRARLNRRLQRQGMTPAASRKPSMATIRRLRAARIAAARHQAAHSAAEDVDYGEPFDDATFEEPQVQAQPTSSQSTDVAYGDPQMVEAASVSPSAEDFYVDEEPEQSGSGAGLAIAAIAAAGLAFTLMS